MQKVILITGSTDGIGLATAELLLSQGHHVLIHGRSEAKLAAVERRLASIASEGSVEIYAADLSTMGNVEALAKAVMQGHKKLDVLINNAGIFRTPDSITSEGLDVRFAVNTVAPYLLTKKLIRLFDSSGRVVNLSSAAQQPVSVQALLGRIRLSDELAAYAQSKLALTMWSRSLAESLGSTGPKIIAVNPGSLLASKMVTEGFGVAGNDLMKGAEILVRTALSDEFEDASGKYFDNDKGQISAPHGDALNAEKVEEIVSSIEDLLVRGNKLQ